MNGSNRIQNTSSLKMKSKPAVRTVCPTQLTGPNENAPSSAAYTGYTDAPTQGLLPPPPHNTPRQATPPHKHVQSRHNRPSSSLLCGLSAVTEVALPRSKFNLPRRRLRSLPGGRAADAACSPSRGRRAPRLRGKAASLSPQPPQRSAAPGLRSPAAPPPTAPFRGALEPASPERPPHGRGAVARRRALVWRRTYRPATLTAAALQLS